MTHCRKFCFKAALFCVVIVKSREKWGGISGKRERDFILCQQVPTARKSRRTGRINGTLFWKKKKATRKTCIAK